MNAIPLTTDAPAEMFRGARIVTPFDLADPAYSQPMTIMDAGKAFSMNWQPDTIPVWKFIERICEHREGAKDGPSFVLARMKAGRRLLTSVEANYGIGLDVDNGFPPEKLDERLARFKYFAGRYTTHSHAKTSSTFARSRIVKFCGHDQFTDKIVRDYAIEVMGWEPAIAETICDHELIEEGKAKLVKCVHAPMAKNRVIVPLRTPYVPSGLQGNTVRDWGRIPQALAKGLGIPIDRACLDAARVFFYPRHAPGRPHEIAVFGGPLFDFNTLTLESLPTRPEPKNKFHTAAVDATDVTEWYRRNRLTFQIIDCVEEHSPEKIRGVASAPGGVTCECPFDEEHSNAGDERDQACFMLNAGETRVGGFVVWCGHGACQGRKPGEFFAKMVRDGWFQ